MGLFKKAYGCKLCRRRVRKKPVDMVQLDLFGDIFNEVLYVRSSSKRSSDGKKAFPEDVFGCSSVDSSNECS